VKSLETDTVSMKLFPKAISEVVAFGTFRYQQSPDADARLTRPTSFT
jgi:hypothetical protein